MATTEVDPFPVAELLLQALVGQECTVVQDSIAEQLVVGFGSPTLARWPLRDTLTAPWLLYTRYGRWHASDGVRTVVSDEEPLGHSALQRLRAVLLNQQVLIVEVSPDTALLRLRFSNGAELWLERHMESGPEDDAWSVHAPGQLVIEGRPGRVSVARVVDGSTQPPQRTSAAVHELLRGAAAAMGYMLFEPPAARDSGFDAVLTAPNGTVLLLQVKSGPKKQLSLHAVAVRRDAPTPTTTEIPLKDQSVDAVAAQLRDAVTAA